MCSSVTSAKYLYKYIYKCPDHMSLEEQPELSDHEVQQFVDAW